MQHDHLLTVDQVCERLGVVRRTLEVMWAEGRGPIRIRIGRRAIRIRESDFQAWLAARQDRPAA